MVFYSFLVEEVWLLRHLPQLRQSCENWLFPRKMQFSGKTLFEHFVVMIVEIWNEKKRSSSSCISEKDFPHFLEMFTTSHIQNEFFTRFYPIFPFKHWLDFLADLCVFRLVHSGRNEKIVKLKHSLFSNQVNLTNYFRISVSLEKLVKLIWVCNFDKLLMWFDDFFNFYDLS